MNRYLNHTVVDNVGACLSFACAVHCMAAPLLMTVLPLVGLGFILSESAELALVFGAVGVAVGSFTWGYRNHRKWRVFLMLGGALILIYIARFSRIRGERSNLHGYGRTSASSCSPHQSPPLPYVSTLQNVEQLITVCYAALDSR